MSVIDGPYGVALQVLLTLLVIELGWGIAVLVAWLFGSIVAFYAVGSAATVSFIIASLFYYFEAETTREREEPPDFV
jgi:hypothetical protein